MRSVIAAMRLRLLASTIAAFGAQGAMAQSVALPSGGSVRSGSATIDQQGSGVSIHQTSERAVVNWNSFSIGSGGHVEVVQPNTTSALLNRVTGNDVSHIAGNLTSNGQIFLVNRNGIVVDQQGKVEARGGFVASTLDIDDDDFMAGNLRFAGGGTGSILNRGIIAGGAVALLGSRVANLGTIVSPTGRVAIGSARQATLDLNGDGFLQVAIPSEFDGADGGPLIDQRGLIDVGGGMIVMRAATAREIVRQTINMSGVVRATSVSQQGGTVVLDGGSGGTVAVSGTIDASGARGGRVDISGGDVVLAGATIAATGSDAGGLVRVGGAFQGGHANSATIAAIAEEYTTRFGPVGSLQAARTTTIDAGSTIDVSASVHGGTAIVWSSVQTRQAGTVKASGAVGGAVELSSQGSLVAALSRVAVGKGGSLLLDPKNIYVYNADQFGVQPADPVNGEIRYDDNPGNEATFNVADVKTLMEGGTDVFLRASNDLYWNADLGMGLTDGVGDLSLSAGRSVAIAGYLTLNQSNLTVIANDTLANGVVDADREFGAGEISAFGARIAGGMASGQSGGNVSLTIGSGAGVAKGLAGDMRLASIEGRSISIDAGSGTVSLFDFGAGIDPAFLTAVDALSINGALKVQASNGLTLSGRTVDWRSEATSALTATSPDTVIRFVENGVLTRFGVLRGGSSGGEGGEGGEGGGAAPSDTTRLALGKGAAGVDYSAVYGDAYDAFDGLHLVSGSLQGADTLDSVLASGVIAATGPAAGSGVGDYSVTTSAKPGFGFASGVSGYFVDLRTVSDTLRITPKTLSVTVTGGAYTYGSPASVAAVSGLVGSDAVGLTAAVSGLGSQALSGSGGSYAFAANMAAGQRDFALTGLSGAAAANYTLDLAGTVSATLRIDPKSLTYAGTSTSSTYGTLNGAAFALTGVLFDDQVSLGVSGVSRNGVTSALTATTGVGIYTTLASGLGGAAAGNYVLDTANSTGGQATIDPKTLFYTTTNAASTYGTLAAIAAPILAGVVAGDDVAANAVLMGGTTPLDARTAAGSYSINAALSGAGAGNYVLSGLGNTVGVLSVARRALTATVADTTQVYLSPAALATLSGVVDGDVVFATGTLDNSFEGMVQVGETGVGFRLPDVGAHAFKLVGLGGASASNYALDTSIAQTAALTVTPKPLNYAITSLTTTYGSSLGSIELTILDATSVPLTASIFVTSAVTGTTVALTDAGRLDAGRYVLSGGTLSGTNAFNYMLSPAGQSGSLVVDPKAISYSGLSGSATYGETPPIVGAVLNGAFSFDDVAANVSVLSGTTAVNLTDRSPAGTYAVVASSLGGADAGNYVLTGGTAGTVSIAPRTLYYTMGSAATTYGTLAAPYADLRGILSGDNVVPIFYADGALLTTALNVGTYQGSIGGLSGAQGGNYILSSTGNRGADIYVHRAPLTYSLAAATSVYGNPLNYAPLIWAGMQLGEAAPVSFTRLADDVGQNLVNAGTYIPIVTANIGNNYYLDSVNSSLGQYIVTRRPVDVQSVPVLGPRGTVYGLTAADIKGVTRASGTVGADTIVIAVTLQGVTTSSGGYVNVGSYSLKIGATVGDLYGANYVIRSIADGAFTVSPLTLSPNGRGYANSTYGTLATLEPASPTSLRGDVVNFTGLGIYKDGQGVTLSSTSAAGDYSVRASGLVGADSGNYIYDFGSEVGGLTIAPKALTFNTGNLNTTYGTLVALGTATLTGIIGSDDVVGANSIAGGYDERSAAGSRQFDAPTLSGAAAGNYTLATGGNIRGFLTIAKKALTLTYLSGAPTSWIYGTTQDPARFYQLNGVLAGDTVAATMFAQLIGTAAGNPLAIGDYYGLGALLNAGTYRASIGSGSGLTTLSGESAANYMLRADAATNAAPSFTVSPRTITGSLTVPSTAIYGDAPAISVAFDNAVGTAAVDYAVGTTLGMATRALGRATALPQNLAVGSQQLGVTLAGLDAYNYLLGSPITGQIAITPKTVTANWLTSEVTYATANDAVFSIAGLIAGDDVAPMISFGGDPATKATTLANGFGLGIIVKDIGQYAVTTASLTGSAAGNYIFVGAEGNATVLPKTITYTSDGFAAQYGGLTLPVCGSGCEMSGRDNGLAYGAVTLNGILPSDVNLVSGVPMLSGDLRAFDYVRNTPAGNYLQIVQSLGGSKARNYTLATEGNQAGLVFIIPAWVKASVTGGGRLYTNASIGKYVSLGDPGVVTVRRSDNLTDAQGGNAFYANDRVNVLVQLVDSKGNIVDGSSNLAVGTYTLNPLGLFGPEAANYRLVPESATGSKAGVFTVADQSVFGFSFLGGSGSTYYAPPKIAPATPASGTSFTTSGSTTTNATAGLTGGAGAGASGVLSLTTISADGSSLSVAGSGTVGANAGYTPLGATATAMAAGNVSLIINRGPVTINYGAFAEASGKVEVSLTNLTITAGGEAMAGVEEGLRVAGNLGNGMTGSTGVDVRAFGTANGEASMSLQNGANLGTSAFLGAGASIGANGSLSGGGVTGSMAATLYSPGSLYIGAKVESGYDDHTLTIGFNLGISLLIGGVELSPKISFDTQAIETQATNFANAWVDVAAMMNGSYCDSGCKAERTATAALRATQAKAIELENLMVQASRLQVNGTPTIAYVQFLQSHPELVGFAQNASFDPSARVLIDMAGDISSAVQRYQQLTDSLAQVVAREKSLTAKIAANPAGITADDLVEANSLRAREQQIVTEARSTFRASVVVVNGEIKFQ